VSDPSPLFEGIDTVFYQVCDMDRAIGFYEGVLGLRLLRREGRDWAELQAGDTVLSLSGELATKPHQGGATVVLRASDLAAVEGRLAENGVQRGPVEDMGGAKMLQFFDPDGNEIVALQAPVDSP
jgi:catechol 2,3-dioxygenase-like lactoylglutathione lyase family enzyme